jgi:CubicO group peptidase (beta-lactamase class C family)
MLAALLDGAANLPDDNLPLDLPESFSGQIVIGHRDGILVQASRGLADRAGQVPVTPETLFDMGSLTKQITAAGVVLLAGEGRLSLQEPLSAFFETLPRDIAGRTVHDLLVHTAGLPQYSGGDYDPVDRSAFSAWLATADTSEVAPGTFHYSNPGYSMAARIIEMRSGEDFESFVQTRLLAPAGIGDIGYRNLPDDRVEAIGYRGGEAQGRPSEQPWLEDGPSWNLRGNGGLLTTADALYRWTLALTGGGVLDEAHTALLFAPHAVRDAERGLSYGYGWNVLGEGAARRIYHSGGNLVFVAYVEWQPQPDCVIVVTSNAFDESDIGAVIGEARAALLRTEACGTTD